MDRASSSFDASRLAACARSGRPPMVLPARIGGWPLTGLQQRLVKTDGRLFKHARYYWLLLAEGNLTRRLFGSILQRIAMLAPPVA